MPGDYNRYFTASTSKLILMSICTLGMYEIYWFYKNLRYVDKKNRLALMPLILALLPSLFSFALFDRARDDLAAHQIPIDLKAGLLSIIYFALCFGLWLPDPFWFLISRFTWLPLLSVNSAITSINDKEIADFKNNDKLSGNNWCTVVVGGLLIASIAVGNFMFPEIWE